MLFNSPRLPETELFKLYGKNYYFFKRRNADEFRRIVDLYLRTIAVIGDRIPHKSVAEIGSAKGYLLAVLKRLGWTVQGIEVSPEASEYAVANFGVSTFTGTIEQFASSSAKDTFPVVAAIDVIEHVPDPISFISSITSIVQPSGVLIIDTPNGNSQNIEYLGRAWKGFSPFHIYLFSKQNLERMLSKAGYLPVKCFSYGNRRETQKSASTGAFKNTLKSVLRNLGILENIRTPCQRLMGVTEKWGANGESLIEDAIRRIEKNPSYLETEDAGDELAKDARGDNIVLIAQRQST